jgi:DNA adenine methylase
MDIDFYSGSYDSLVIPESSIIYCDPPYENTAKYSKDGFNSAEF